MAEKHDNRTVTAEEQHGMPSEPRRESAGRNGFGHRLGSVRDALDRQLSHTPIAAAQVAANLAHLHAMSAGRVQQYYKKYLQGEYPDRVEEVAPRTWRLTDHPDNMPQARDERMRETSAQEPRASNGRIMQPRHRQAPQTIRIDPDVYYALQKLAAPFEESPNDVIRRLLQSLGQL